MVNLRILRPSNLYGDYNPKSKIARADARTSGVSPPHGAGKIIDPTLVRVESCREYSSVASNTECHFPEYLNPCII